MKNKLLFAALLSLSTLALAGCTASQLDKAVDVTSKVQEATTQPATKAGIAVIETAAPASAIPIVAAVSAIGLLAGFVKFLDNRAHGKTQDTLHEVATTVAGAVQIATDAGLNTPAAVGVAASALKAAADAVGKIPTAATASA